MDETSQESSFQCNQLVDTKTSNMQEVTQDVQCKKILNGISTFLELLKNELVEKILEITDNTESKEHFNLLKRIERSVDQYVKRSKNLFYIGFLGHYSSGKSSTINSILNIKGSKNERSVNINPTDDRITLITNSSNNEQIVKLIRVGQVPIVLSPIDDNEFLSDKIVMDTPGSGDPSLVEEIVRDSLPLCDLIIYCISAANPIDNSDIPLLREKEKNLNQIPTIYVVTRADEFKINSLKPLDENNFNASEARIALSELASRMHEIVNSLSLDYENFVIIDNKEEFNINRLQSEIARYTNKVDESKILNLHGHKVDFFIRASSRVKYHFTSLIDDKLATMESFVLKAQSNIDEYNNRTNIGSDKLIVEWRNSDDRIKQIIEGSVNENNRLHQTLETAANFNNLLSVEVWLEDTKSISKYTNQGIAEEGKSLLHNRLYDLREKYKEKLYSYAGEDRSISKTEIDNFLSENTIHVSIPIVTSFNYRAEFSKLYDLTLKHITSERYDLLKRAFESLLQRARNKNPIDSIQKHIEDAKSVMADVFESYNEAVKIYRVAAFSAEAKNYIRKLGLSLKLDKLDTETLNIKDYNSRAQEEIFGKYSQEVTDFKDQCELIEKLILESKIDHPIITSHEKESEIDLLAANYIEDIKNSIDNRLDEIFANLKVRLIDLIDTLNSERLKYTSQKNAELKELRTKRIKYYILRYIPSVLVVVFTILIFVFPAKFSFMSVNPTLGWQWILGLLSNIAFTALSTLIIRAKDRYPTKANEVVVRYSKDEKQVISEIVDRMYNPIYLDVGANFKTFLQVTCNEKSEKNIVELLSTRYSENLHRYHKTIYDSEKKVKRAIELYSGLLNKLKSTITTVLNNSKLNKEVVTNQANLIKKTPLAHRLICYSKRRMTFCK